LGDLEPGKRYLRPVPHARGPIQPTLVIGQGSDWVTQQSLGVTKEARNIRGRVIARRHRGNIIHPRAKHFCGWLILKDHGRGKQVREDRAVRLTPLLEAESRNGGAELYPRLIEPT